MSANDNGKATDPTQGNEPDPVQEKAAKGGESASKLYIPDGQIYLPSGAVLDQTSEESDAPKGVSRRGLLAGVGATAVLAAAGATWAFVSNGSTLDPDREIPLVQGGGACGAPQYAAFHKGFFEKQGLNVTMKKTADDEDVKAAVGSGKFLGSVDIFFAYLKPIEQGQDIKLTTALHEGCLRLLAHKKGPIKQVSDLRGKKIGVGSMAGYGVTFFSLDLLDAGINPLPEAGEVEWVVIDNALLPEALNNGDVDAIAAADPIALLPVFAGDAFELSNDMISKTNKQMFCCATALNGTFVREDPETARKLVTAWAEGSRWAGANIEETAQISIDNGYVAGKHGEVVDMLRTYNFNPFNIGLRDAMLPGINKFSKTGFLDPRTDPVELTDKVHADLGLKW